MLDNLEGWKERDAACRFIIEEGISTHTAMELERLPTAAALWDKLKERYLSRSALERYHMMDALVQYVKPADESLVSSITQVENMAADLDDLAGIHVDKALVYY